MVKSVYLQKYFLHTHWRRLHSMRSRVYATVRRPSVCPSVCLSDPSTAGRAGLLLSAGVYSRYRSIADAPTTRAQQMMRVASCWNPMDEVLQRLVYLAVQDSAGNTTEENSCVSLFFRIQIRQLSSAKACGQYNHSSKIFRFLTGDAG